MGQMGHVKSMREVVEEYVRGGVSLRGLSRRDGVPRATLQRWIKRYEKGDEGSSGTRVLAEVEMPREVKQLQRELYEARLEAKLYRTMVEVAEKELGIPIRKKSGAK